MQDFDVIIIGYGPTGKVLARLLSDAGKSVAIVERWPAAYPLPRAVGYDHEIKRMMHKLGVAQKIEAVSRPMHHYIWYNADWKVLIELDQSVESISGGPLGYLFNQPELEQILEEDLLGRPGISLFLSHEALSVSQNENGASVVLAPFSGADVPVDMAEAKTISARYLVGCDGANSIVRTAMDSEIYDHGFDADWLVVDVIPNEGTDLPIPDAAQWCNPARPTTIVPSGVRNRRWEFMVMPGEDLEELAREEKVWELLSPWITPKDGKIIRSATYNFRSRLARGWRKGRFLIAGDAAHLMPPFIGQGMCSGLRDAWTLGWKLAAVLDERATESILDDYETERSAHVDAVIRTSMQMGQIVCVPDEAAAAERDAAFFSGKVPPPPAFPGLSGGMIDTDETGAPIGLAGALMPHSDLSDGTRTVRLDDLRDRPGFVLLVNGLAHDGITPVAAAAMEALDCLAVPFSPARYSDVSGRLSEMFAESGAKAVLVRPDFYAFGSAETADQAEAMLVRAARMLTGKDIGATVKATAK